MKKQILIVFTLLLPIILFAQPKIENAENFVNGTVLTFQNCESENVEVGKSGKNQTWDFSSLKEKKDDLTIEEMILPQKTSFATKFPESNLVEKYSDGRLVFMNKTENENHLLGFVDTNSNMTMNYTKPMLFAKRPIKFKDNFQGNYEAEYSVKGMDFKGKGEVSITADGYGTLILPNGKYENVLRVKITQKQTDTMKQYQSQSTTETISYVWFDENHTSALLKIDETKSTYYDDKSVQYLLSEVINEK